MDKDAAIPGKCQFPMLANFSRRHPYNEGVLG